MNTACMRDSNVFKEVNRILSSYSILEKLLVAVSAINNRKRKHGLLRHVQGTRPYSRREGSRVQDVSTNTLLF